MPDLPPQQPQPPQQNDPIVSRQMSLLILISVFLLLLTVAWSLYSEFFGLRPWRAYQDRFRDLYSAYLKKQVQARLTQEQSVYSTPDYKRLKAAVDSAIAAAAVSDRPTQAQVDLLDRERAAMTPAFQTARGQVGALTYQLEQIPESDKSAKASKLKDLNEAKAGTYELNWPTANGTELRKMSSAVT